MKQKRSVVAVVVPKWDNSEIIAVSRRSDYKDLGLPGGKVEEGETSAEAMSRELFEEIGLKVSPEVLCMNVLIKEKLCGEYLVDVYFLKLINYNLKHDLVKLREELAECSIINEEDCTVKLADISEICEDHCSFNEFNKDVWKVLRSNNLMPWINAEDINAQGLYNILAGTCTNSIDSAIDTLSEEKLNWSDIPDDVFHELYDLTIECEICGWWSYGPSCDECETEEEED